MIRYSRIGFALCFGALLAACAVENAPSDGVVSDDPVVLFAGGSCEGACGGRAEGCWCDDLCERYGDCCVDKAAVCDGDGDSGSDDGGSDDSDDGSDDGGSDDGGSGDVPATAHCAPAADWPEQAQQYEAEVLALVNQARATGGTCGNDSFAPSAPLASDPALRCAARLHSLDMATQDYFSHTNTAGQSPFDRMAAAGYAFWYAGENIAAGYPTPQSVVQGWLDSPGHCANILRADYTETGVGYATGGSYGRTWTQAFGAPAN